MSAKLTLIQLTVALFTPLELMPSQKNSPTMTTRSAEKSAQSVVSSVVQDILSNKTFLKLVETEVDKRLTELKTSVEKLEAQVMDLEVHSEEREKRIKELSKKLETQSSEIHSLKQTANLQEQYSRRNCLRFFGIKEQERENTDDVIVSLVNDVLKVPLTKSDIERSHRISSRQRIQETSKKSKTSPPRPIIVKFISYRTRQTVLTNRRKLAGHHKSIQEDLTSMNAKLLSDAKKCRGVETAWSSDGRIIALVKTNNGTMKRMIGSPDDLRRLGT